MVGGGDPFQAVRHSSA